MGRNMNIAILTNSPENIPDKLMKLPKKNRNSVEVLPGSDLRKIVKEDRGIDMIYLDSSSVKKIDSTVNYLARQNTVLWGIIDLNNLIGDVAILFLNGCVDYIDKITAERIVFSRRINLIEKYLGKYRSEWLQNKKKSYDDNVSIDWNNIAEGGEYPFFIMFIELDGRSRFEKTWGKSNLEKAVRHFQLFIERMVASYNGKIWMWSGFGGIVLFPFAGNHDAILCGFRLMLYKYVFDVEESLFPNFISFRMALHLGEMRYSSRRKGHVISDSINFVVHLGKRYARPGNFYVSDRAMNSCMGALKGYFVREREYEERIIYRMKKPVLIPQDKKI